MSSTIIVNKSNITDSTNNSIFKYTFDSPTELTGKEIALVSTSLNYSWRNITEANNTFIYKFLADDYFSTQITIPPGLYEISDINAYMQFIFRQNGHYLKKVDTYVYYAEFVVNPTNYSIDLITYPFPASLPAGYTDPTGNFPFYDTPIHMEIKIDSKLTEILGFPANFNTGFSLSDTPNVYSSTQAPNVNPNSSLTLICDEASNEFSSLGVLYSIVPQVSIGSIFTERPSYPIYLNCKHGTFSSLTFRLVNSDTLMPIEILDPNICFIFSIKSNKK